MSYLTIKYTTSKIQVDNLNTKSIENRCKADFSNIYIKKTRTYANTCLKKLGFPNR